VPSPLLQTVETVTSTVGGCAALGSIVMCTIEITRDEPRWDTAIGTGSVADALAGAAILLIDMTSGV
jgi:hypothetical protein